MSKNRSETYKLADGGTLHIDYVIEPIIPHPPIAEHYAHPRYYVEWDGHAESDFLVCDGKERQVVKTIRSAFKGAMHARRIAFLEAAKLNSVHYGSAMREGEL